ncbi:hypothetical protein DY000_02039578 [Brassica cretica]|uniref:Uncharacterized protein n=1 Tax=Brassica cretica TaxID=69181 RepID=A0ABQ7BEG9_BRACR|nr:hypothetical protein DY000_02039578 [Brassica cretica]
MLVLLKGGQSTPSSSAIDHTTSSATRPSRPSAELNHGARRMVEIDRPHDQIGRSTGWTGWTEHTVQLSGWPSWIQLSGWPSWIDHATSSAARRMAELLAWSIKLGHPLSWTSSSADGRAGSTTRSAWPFDGLDQSSPSDGRAGSAKPSSSRPRSSRDLIKLSLVSFRSEAPLELYDFKTTRTRFLV